jgi:hypothetical protein
MLLKMNDITALRCRSVASLEGYSIVKRIEISDYWYTSTVIQQTILF